MDCPDCGAGLFTEYERGIGRCGSCHLRQRAEAAEHRLEAALEAISAAQHYIEALEGGYDPTVWPAIFEAKSAEAAGR